MRTTEAALPLGKQNACEDPVHREQTAENDSCQIDGQEKFLFRHVIGEKIRDAHGSENTRSGGKLHERDQDQQMQHQKRTAAQEKSFRELSPSRTIQRRVTWIFCRGGWEKQVHTAAISKRV